MLLPQTFIHFAKPCFYHKLLCILSNLVSTTNLYILPNHASTTNFYTFWQTMLLPQTFIHFAKPCFYTCVKKGKISFVLEQNESHSKNGAFQSKLLFHSLRGDSFAFYSQHVKMVLLVRSMFLSQPFLSIQTSIYPYGFSP